MLNRYLWELYLKSDGKETVEAFKENLSNEYSEDYAKLISKLHKEYNPNKKINKQIEGDLICLIEHINNANYIEGTDVLYISLLNYDNDESIEECDLTKENILYFFEYIEYYTTIFAIESPEVFIPYYFKYNFNVLEIIAQEFEIELPTMPAKKDYKGRIFYYGEICRSLNKFRDENNMSLYELCAFLYDFAPKYIGGIDSYIVNDLPEPRDCYFIGGGKDDAFLSHEESTITPWQCNPETLAGDMIVMYLTTPISAVDSIWRSVSVGFNDPFFYYYRCAYIGKPKKIKQISQETLKKDKLIGQLPIVRKNMQGINGTEIHPSMYNHLLDISKADLPRFENIILESDGEYLIEKDVENKLIIPLLEKLGYSQNDYVPQLHIRIGNHNSTLIPDFVVKPKISNGHTSASIIIEAKLTIPTKKILEETLIQARSYANQLRSKYCIIASKEKIWVYKKDDDYTSDIISLKWNEVFENDNLNLMFKLIGNKEK